MANPWEMDWGSGNPWEMQWDAPKEPTSASSRFVQGMRDPVDAGAQMLTKSLPSGVVGAVNKAAGYVNNLPLIGPVTKALGMTPATPEQIDAGIASREANYTAPEGIDWARVGGSILSTAPLAAAAPVGTGMLSRIGAGAATGGVFGGLNPVTQNQGNFWDEKKGQVGAGAVAGGVLAPVAAGISRVISPKISPDVQKMMDAGVTPTIGQRLGGIFNTLEQKATSIPILGDAISYGRNQAKDQFNTAAINEALKPVGQKITGSGNTAIKEAGDILSGIYEQAKNKIGGFQIDAQANQEIGNLLSMTQNLTPQMAKKFEKTYTNIFESRLSPNGSLLADSFKKIDSELGKDAARYQGSMTASEKELGDAMAELQRIIVDNARRANPEAQKLMEKADAGWARLVRLENAANAAKKTDGVFTPGQLLQGVKASDKSVRDRATARGTALMQDFAQSGERVLGSQYPDSGTAGRMMLGGLTAGLGSAVNPAIPLGLAAASLPYLNGGRQATNWLLSARPRGAAGLASIVERAPAGLLAPAMYQVATQ